jgi:uncharacterized SAM-binding protein YcdF (DUF218 family)
MLALTKFLTWLASPLVVALALGLLAWWQAYRGRRRGAVLWLALAVLWLLLWSSTPFYGWFGSTLERQYPPRRAEDMPKADAIVVLGGGMEWSRDLPYPDMNGAADRIWHAARLFKAGRAPIVIPTGAWEDVSSVPLLLDFGVPSAAIRAETASRNTAENARFTAALLARLGCGRRVLLVTSAWHMRRAQLLFERAGLEVIPAATDYEATIVRMRPDCWSLQDWLPNPDALNRNTGILKEYIGYWVARFGVRDPGRALSGGACPAHSKRDGKSSPTPRPAAAEKSGGQPPHSKL